MALIKVGALWLSREGSKAKYSGKLRFGDQDRKIVVFENRDKQGKQPDFTIHLIDDSEDAPRPTPRKPVPADVVDEETPF